MKIIFYTLNIFLVLELYFNFENNNKSKMYSFQEEENYKIYLIKNYWHTGIVFPINEKSLSLIGALNYFKDRKFVDVGWGDEKFYQHPGFDLFLAARAILFPTSSAIRVEGFNYDDINIYLSQCDEAIEIPLKKNELDSIYIFINKAFEKDKENKLQILSSRQEGRLIFFKSIYKYHLFNTCNTFVVKAFDGTRYKINPEGIVTVQQLFNAFLKFDNVRRIK